MSILRELRRGPGFVFEQTSSSRSSGIQALQLAEVTGAFPSLYTYMSFQTGTIALLFGARLPRSISGFSAAGMVVRGDVLSILGPA